MPYKRLSEMSDGLREIWITPPPRVDGLRMGDAETIRYLGCPNQVVHINSPTHGDALYVPKCVDYSLSQAGPNGLRSSREGL